METWMIVAIAIFVVAIIFAYIIAFCTMSADEEEQMERWAEEYIRKYEDRHGGEFND